MTVLRLQLRPFDYWWYVLFTVGESSTSYLWHHLRPKKCSLTWASPARGEESGFLFRSQLVTLPWISKQATGLLSSISRMLTQLVILRYPFCNQNLRWSTAQEAGWHSILYTFHPVPPAGEIVSPRRGHYPLEYVEKTTTNFSCWQKAKLKRKKIMWTLAALELIRNVLFFLKKKKRKEK